MVCDPLVGLFMKLKGIKQCHILCIKVISLLDKTNVFLIFLKSLLQRSVELLIELVKFEEHPCVLPVKVKGLLKAAKGFLRGVFLVVVGN